MKLSDGMIDAYPGTNSRLYPDCKIVHCTTLESDVVKIQAQKLLRLTAEESNSSRTLTKVERVGNSCSRNQGLSLAENLLKQI